MTVSAWDGRGLRRVRRETPPVEFVPDSRFGSWFLGTKVWREFVIRRAVRDVRRLLPLGKRFPVILDVGCGHGGAFAYLAERFSPERIIGLDADVRARLWAAAAVKATPCQTEIVIAGASATGLAASSVDMVFCHQTFHHIVDQEGAAREFMRVLKPGGCLLFAESTKAYIDTWLIRWLFRHPMHVQKTVEEYVALIRDAGFSLPDAHVSLPYMWWSYPNLRVLEAVGVTLPGSRARTIVNAVALKPA